MNKTMRNILLIILLVPGMVTALVAQKSVELKYKLNGGDSYQYTMDMDQDIVFEANGQPMALDQVMTMNMLMQMKNVTDDSIHIESQIKKVKMTQGMYGMTISYDSDDPASAQNPMTAQIAKQLAPMINQTFFITMDHKGNVGSMDMRNLTDNDDIANSLNSGGQFASYPEGKVSVGDSWTKDVYASEMSDMQIKATYTLLKISGKTATIGLDGTITANETEDVDMRMNGTQKGEMIIDLKTGWLVESKLDQEIKLDIEQNGQKFPATISGTITMTSSRLN